MLQRLSVLGLLTAFSLAFAGPTQAQSVAKPAATAAKHVKPTKSVKARKARVVMPAVPVGKIVVQNKRQATLLELSITPTKAKQPEPTQIAHDLAPGQRAVAPIPKKAGCTFAISGNFDDDSTVDVPDQNLCKDGAITLVE